MEKKKRYNNYDLLRVVCAISVIIIHVSSYYYDAITNEKVLNGLYDRNTFEIILCKLVLKHF